MKDKKSSQIAYLNVRITQKHILSIDYNNVTLHRVENNTSQNKKSL